MAKKTAQSRDKYCLEFYGADGGIDDVSEFYSDYAEAVTDAKESPWFEGETGRHIIVQRYTQVARVERPAAVVTKL